MSSKIIPHPPISGQHHISIVLQIDKEMASSSSITSVRVEITGLQKYLPQKKKKTLTTKITTVQLLVYQKRLINNQLNYNYFIGSFFLSFFGSIRNSFHWIILDN